MINAVWRSFGVTTSAISHHSCRGSKRRFAREQSGPLETGFQDYVKQFKIGSEYSCVRLGLVRVLQPVRLADRLLTRLPRSEQALFCVPGAVHTVRTSLVILEWRFSLSITLGVQKFPNPASGRLSIDFVDFFSRLHLPLTPTSLYKGEGSRKSISLSLYSRKHHILDPWPQLHP